jgi:AcrR family transcriptional regulator
MRQVEYRVAEPDIEAPPGSDSRQRIVRAAYPLFVELGYDAVSMQEIADAVPLNKATLYHHFQSKDDLFLAVVRMAMSMLFGQIEQIIESGGAAADQLTKVAYQIFRDSQSEFGRLMTDARLHLSLEQQQVLTDRRSDPWTLYQRIFESATERGEIPAVDPVLASTMFAGLIHGQTWSVKMGRIPPPLDESRARLLVDTLFGGLNAVFADSASSNGSRS